MKKYFIFLLLISISLTGLSQNDSAVNNNDEKIVSITVSGQGNTIEQARTSALRSAIEQAFGAFISSNTAVLNDSLVKDEIVSISNGNIQKYDILNESTLPNGTSSSTIKAVVSINKLTTFCQSKGMKIEMNGGLFSMNIKIKKLNQDAEYKSILNLCTISKEILDKSFDYKVNAQDPIFVNPNYNLNLKVDVEANSNYNSFVEYFSKTLKSISISEQEYNDYIRLNLPVFELVLYDLSPTEIISLRDLRSYTAIVNLLTKSIDNLFDFKILNGKEILVKKEYWQGIQYEGNKNSYGWSIRSKSHDFTDYEKVKSESDFQLPFSKRIYSSWPNYIKTNIDEVKRKLADRFDPTYYNNSEKSFVFFNYLAGDSNFLKLESYFFTSTDDYKKLFINRYSEYLINAIRLKGYINNTDGASDERKGFLMVSFKDELKEFTLEKTLSLKLEDIEKIKTIEIVKATTK